ncbi:hypothetical protein BS333_06030 [Vibrio azureus]|uniref:Oxidoreductase molybdopterin-binding domain-containing protein n=2 Tax=Vibrio azureus TaxID=512649 RepID=U3ALW2_9VIBR|nr:hypothetical protein [Vibrio azureus]AUI85975.1 hypothetical protein BS333_06030 [Vibrio azureus]GAD74282.1 hypothetical protein VAZ01S_008_00240 [Vibrio azureus NBRC 104587]
MRTIVFYIIFIFSISCQANPEPELNVIDKSGNVYTYSIEELQSLPQKEVITVLPWFEGDNTFSGFLLTDLLKKNKITMPEMVTILALNDYKVTISKSDIIKYEPIIALKMSGEYMNVKNKGPFWLIFSLSDFKEIDTLEYHAKMIWQIKEIYLN